MLCLSLPDDYQIDSRRAQSPGPRVRMFDVCKCPILSYLPSIPFGRLVYVFDVSAGGTQEKGGGQNGSVFVMDGTHQAQVALGTYLNVFCGASKLTS